jgi:hypothetical protein
VFSVIGGTAQARPGLPCHSHVYKKNAGRDRIVPRLHQMIALNAP